MTPSERQNHEKQVTARHAITYVEDGMTIGLGTGSTAAWAIRFLGKRVRGGLSIRGVPTSIATDCLATQEGIPLVGLADVSELDLTLDGADEVDPKLRLIKGGGGALVREKVVASASRRLIILVDASKDVPVLGAFPLPVAVVPFSAPVVARRIEALGASVKLRTGANQHPFVSDDGLHILDCAFGKIADAEGLARHLESIPGLVDHGMFLNMADIVVFAKGDQVTERRR